jgi:hypothetical protein
MKISTQKASHLLQLYGGFIVTSNGLGWFRALAFVMNNYVTLCSELSNDINVEEQWQSMPNALCGCTTISKWPNLYNKDYNHSVHSLNNTIHAVISLLSHVGAPGINCNSKSRIKRYIPCFYCGWLLWNETWIPSVELFLFDQLDPKPKEEAADVLPPIHKNTFQKQRSEYQVTNIALL